MKKVLSLLSATHGRSAFPVATAAAQHGTPVVGSARLLRQVTRKATRVGQGWLMLACAPVLLSGCFGASDIDVVKNAVWNAMPDTTIGKALDSRVSCKSTHWRVFDDERGRRIVEYACEYQGVQEYLASEAQRVVSLYDQEVQGNLALQNEMLKRAQTKVQSLRDGKAEMQSRHVQWAAEDEERSKAIQNDLQTLESMRDCRAFQPELLQTKGMGTQLKFEAKRCGRYSRASDDPYVQQWGSLVRQLQGDLQRLVRSVDVRREQMAERDSAIAKAEAELAALDEQKSQKALEVQEKGAAAQAEFQSKASQHLKQYKGMREVSQWSIVNGEPVYVGSAVELQAGSATMSQPVLASFVINEARDNTPDWARRERATRVIDNLWERYKRESGI